MSRLNAALLDTITEGIARPAYHRDQPCGVVHLGTGAFHRAHQAAYFDALLAKGEAGWMIRGASLRSATVAEQMNPQDGLYTLVVRDGTKERLQVIGAIAGVMVAPENPDALVAALAHPDTGLVTLTVTEKGYCIDPASGALREGDPVLAADLADLSAPRTAPGFLVAGLKARRRAGLAPFTVLSCDNLPENGVRTREAVLQFARQAEPALADWIAEEGAFPSSMVDRIVPATTPGDIDALEARTGYRDQAMVKTEPFTQWVVEDWFAGRRPPLERVGVEMTRDVAAWEKAKLRLLNGAHSTLAYLGALAGHDFVHEAIAAPGFSDLIEAVWDEAEATLDPIDGFDPAAYRAELARRFANSALEHRTVQIAMDGSQKLPQRLLNTIRERRARGLKAPALCLAVAGWMRWQIGRDEAGRSYAVDDPLAETTAAAISAAGGDPAVMVRALLRIEPVFGRDLPTDAGFVNALTTALETLIGLGAAATVSTCTARRNGGSWWD